MNTRTALGTCLVLTAILAGAAFLDRAQRLVPSRRVRARHLLDAFLPDLHFMSAIGRLIRLIGLDLPDQSGCVRSSSRADLIEHLVIAGDVLGVV